MGLANNLGAEKIGFGKNHEKNLGPKKKISQKNWVPKKILVPHVDGVGHRTVRRYYMTVIVMLYVG